MKFLSESYWECKILTPISVLSPDSSRSFKEGWSCCQIRPAQVTVTTPECGAMA